MLMTPQQNGLALVLLVLAVLASRHMRRALHAHRELVRLCRLHTVGRISAFPDTTTPPLRTVARRNTRL